MSGWNRAGEPYVLTTVRTLGLLLLLPLFACSAVPDENRPVPGTAQVSPSRSTQPPQSLKSAPDFQARVFWDGRIAFPTVGLLTRARCPFVIRDVQAGSSGGLVLIGHEATEGCDDEESRQSTWHRLPDDLKRAWDSEQRVVVRSKNPAYTTEAEVLPGVA